MICVSKTSLAAVAALVASSPAVARTVTIPFSPANFSDPLDIDNPYFPLITGTVWTYRADTPDGCEVDVMTVTNKTKNLDGIVTRVVHDVVSEGETCSGSLEKAEDTFDYYAQDNAGNVWYMGEDTFDCDESGCTRGEGSWLAGVNGAKPGTVMLAHPRSGDSYRQEFSPGIAEDQALITATGVTARLTRSDAYRHTFQNCILSKEWTVLERGAIEFKTYCPNIGNVLTVEHHGKVVRSELTDFSSPADALRFRVPPKH
jgi:hypothetical protein